MATSDPRRAAAPAAIGAFRKLHESGCFVLPNPWDVGSAVYLQHLGFKALATTSAGFAFSQGLPDLVSAIALQTMLAHVAQMAAATALPVNADFQSGYAVQPEGVAKNVTLCVRTGVAGLSIEDAIDDATTLYERTLAVERIRAARAAIDATGIPVVLTARCEAWLVGHPDPARTALDRLVAFAEAGADCLYAPGVTDFNTIASIVKAVAPKPVNVLMSGPQPGLSLSRLAELGVRRISVGASLARSAWAGFMRAAQGLLSGDTFDSLAGGASFDELNSLFVDRSAGK